MKPDRIGALVTALPFAVAGALLFAGWLWASRQRAADPPPTTLDQGVPATDRARPVPGDDAGQTGTTGRSR